MKLKICKTIHKNWWTLIPTIDVSFLRPYNDEEVYISVHFAFLVFSLSLNDIKIRVAKSRQLSDSENIDK